MSRESCTAHNTSWSTMATYHSRAVVTNSAVGHRAHYEAADISLRSNTSVGDTCSGRFMSRVLIVRTTSSLHIRQQLLDSIKKQYLLYTCVLKTKCSNTSGTRIDWTVGCRLYMRSDTYNFISFLSNHKDTNESYLVIRIPMCQ